MFISAKGFLCLLWNPVKRQPHLLQMTVIYHLPYNHGVIKMTAICYQFASHPCPWYLMSNVSFTNKWFADSIYFIYCKNNGN